MVGNGVQWYLSLLEMPAVYAGEEKHGRLPGRRKQKKQNRNHGTLLIAVSQYTLSEIHFVR